MEAKLVCKVMLFSYRELEKRCDLIDRAIYTTAIRSAFRDTWEAYKEIEQLTREKVAYINTKVVIDQALATVKKKYELEQYHINGISIEKLAEEFNVNRNIIEHRLCRQREKLYKAMLNIYSGGELLNIICDSGRLKDKYKQAVKCAYNNQDQEE